MKTVVVTGAAGSLGAKVAARLAARPDVERVVGIDVIPFAPTDPKIDVRVLDLAARPGPGDRELERAMDGAGAVIHLAWKVENGRRAVPADGAAANHRMLARLLDIAGKGGVEVIVHASSATVYGAWADNKIPLTEDARLRPNPEFSFAVSKAEAERTLTEWADSHPAARIAVLRPTVTVGSDERPLYQALGITRSPSPGDSGRPVQYLHVEDLASAVVLAWEKSLTGVYNVAPDAGITEEEARALAGGVARVALPERVWGWASALSWRLWRRGVPSEARAYATHPWVVAPDRLKAQGWSPEYSSEEALVATDDRLHWGDLPPGRRQNYNLLISVIAVAGVGAGLAAGVAWLRKRSGSRAGS